jgi:hypothetical protein
MSTLFTINFRREAYRQAVARARGRVVALGVWLAYFGVLAVLVGLFALNSMALSSQVRQIERQTVRIRKLQGTTGSWKVADAELAQIEKYARSPRQWHDRLVRLATVLPPDVVLQSIAVNPQNVTGAADAEKLVLTGQLRRGAGQDRMKGVMGLVGVLQRDSLFSRHYRSVKLASTRIGEDAGGAAEFVIECR